MEEKTKEELSEELNELLGTEINFMKLNKEELVDLYKAVLKIKEASAIFPLLDKPIGQILDKKFLGKPLKDMTLRELFGLSKERKGFFGLGIMSRIINKLEET